MRQEERYLPGMSVLVSHPGAGSIEKQLALFADVGFRRVFISAGVTEEWDKIPAWASAAGRCGVQIEAVHAPTCGVDGVWQGTEEGVVYGETLRHIVARCAAGGVPKTVLHTGRSRLTQVTEAGLSFWRETEAFAREQGVQLCYENADTPALFEAVVRQSDRYHGVCHDVGHQWCYTPDRHYETLFGDRIVFTHLHDNGGVGGGDLHLLPFDGTGDWAAYLSGLCCAGYTGTLNLELSCFHREEYRSLSFRAFAEQAYDRVCRLKQALEETV